MQRLVRKLSHDGGKAAVLLRGWGHSGAPVLVSLNSTDPAARSCTVVSTGGRHYQIGIDVSSKESALCILDRKGKIVRETKLPTDLEVIARFVAATGLTIERIGLE